MNDIEFKSMNGLLFIERHAGVVFFFGFRMKNETKRNGIKNVKILSNRDGIQYIRNFIQTGKTMEKL